jgi:hypothetical protein
MRRRSETWTRTPQSLLAMELGRMIYLIEERALV